MPGLFPPFLHLNEMERAELTQLVNKHTTPQQIALRARIILMAENGLNHRQIARQLKISRKKVFYKSILSMSYVAIGYHHKW
ncbi:helix-turn-helix domain-containing protein [Candidatus Poribacteria bacterium]|nr:helix-turn-helix domain-containing protein [Candidatus Poribacteria bacterium]